MAILLATEPASDYQAAAQIIAELPTRLDTTRAARGLTLKQQAAGIGITTTTLTRVLAGGDSTRGTILACLNWLAAPAL